MKQQKSITGIACGIFRKEIDLLLQEKKISIPFTYLDSMLHMDPSALNRALQAALCDKRQKEEAIVLVYGDCSAHMIDFESFNNVARVRGINCYEIIVGREMYHRLLSDRAFFVMPEWAAQFRKVFHHRLGLKGEVARTLMTELYTKLIYIDSGLYSIADGILNAISEYSGLPLEILPVSLDRLTVSINETVERIQVQ